MKERVSVDGENRLILQTAQGNRVLDGSFVIERDNSLGYDLNELPLWFREAGYKEKLSFDGNWSLNENCDLEFRLRQAGIQGETQILTLKGAIISTESDKLVFEIKSRNKNSQSEFTILNLNGQWQADAHNRICFQITRKDSPDIITLQGAWQLNKNQQIIYTYQKTDLETKEKSSCFIVFNGFWEICASQRLSYVFSTGGLSRFDLRVQLETPNVYPKAGTIKYRIGIGIKETAADVQQLISIFGVWKFGRNLGLAFEMEYEKGEFHACNFGAQVNLSKQDEIIFGITNTQGQPLGFNLIFSHRFLKDLDAQVFVQLKKISNESGIYAGLRIPF